MCSIWEGFIHDFIVKMFSMKLLQRKEEENTSVTENDITENQDDNGWVYLRFLPNPQEFLEQLEWKETADVFVWSSRLWSHYI